MVAKDAQNKDNMELTLGQALLSLLPSLLGGLTGGGGGNQVAAQQQLLQLQQAFDSFEQEMRSKITAAQIMGGIALFLAFIAIVLVIAKKK